MAAMFHPRYSCTSVMGEAIPVYVVVCRVESVDEKLLNTLKVTQKLLVLLEIRIRLNICVWGGGADSPTPA